MTASNIIIRTEQESDLPEIYDLIRTAFKTARVRDGKEQDFAVRLRESEGYIPELALVVENKGKLAGHVMLTRTIIKPVNGDAPHTALLLAPLSVLKEYRNRGIGGMLVKEALERAAEMGFDSVFLVGDPGYYGRFGFAEVSGYGLYPKGEIPSRFVLGYELKPGIFSSITGTLECF